MNIKTFSGYQKALIHFIRVVWALTFVLGIAGVPQNTGRATAVDWDIPGPPRIFAQYTDDHIRFEYTDPGAEVTFSIYESQGGNLLWEESRTADESGFAMVSIWDHRVDLQPGMFVMVSDGTTTKELLLEPLSLDTFDPDENVMAGTAAPGREVWVVANNDPDSCGVVVTADENGDWSYDFDNQDCDVYDASGSYAQVMDEDDDTTEVFVAFIDGWHDYDMGDVPHWACNAGGWAVDSDDRDRDLEIRILADGEQDENVVATTRAENPTDLIGVCGADGTCGYEVSLWGQISPYEEHQIFVQAYDEETGQWFGLNGDPKPLTCRTYDIYIYDTLTGETRPLTDLRDSWEFNPRWSPDGKQVVHDRWSLDLENNMGVHITQVDTGESAPLAGAENGSYPFWSPNGQWIAFNQGDDLYLLPPGGGEPSLVRADAFMASWAPNSQRLVFSQPSDGSIRTADLNGENVTLVVERGNGPAWSPNGQWIAYEMDGDLWKVRVNMLGVPLGSPIRMTNEPAWEGRPSWSNNSQTIVIHKGFDRDTDLWAIPSMGGTANWLTGAPNFADYDPNYSNNGRYVAYSSFSPAGQAPRSWVSAYTFDLPAGISSEGGYPYHFEFEWSSPEPGQFSGQGGELVVSEDAPSYDGYVLLRGIMELAGVDTEDGLVCGEVSEINPNQPVRFLIGWLPDGEMTYPEAQAHFASISASVVWGDTMSAELVGHGILPFYSTTDWFPYMCSFSRPKPMFALQAEWSGYFNTVFLPVLASVNP